MWSQHLAAVYLLLKSKGTFADKTQSQPILNFLNNLNTNHKDIILTQDSHYDQQGLPSHTSHILQHSPPNDSLEDFADSDKMWWSGRGLYSPPWLNSYIKTKQKRHRGKTTTAQMHILNLGKIRKKSHGPRRRRNAPDDLNRWRFERDVQHQSMKSQSRPFRLMGPYPPEPFFISRSDNFMGVPQTFSQVVPMGVPQAVSQVVPIGAPQALSHVVPLRVGQKFGGVVLPPHLGGVARCRVHCSGPGPSCCGSSPWGTFSPYVESSLLENWLSPLLQVPGSIISSLTNIDKIPVILLVGLIVAGVTLELLNKQGGLEAQDGLLQEDIILVNMDDESWINKLDLYVSRNKNLRDVQHFTCCLAPVTSGPQGDRGDGGVREGDGGGQEGDVMRCRPKRKNFMGSTNTTLQCATNLTYDIRLNKNIQPQKYLQNIIFTK